MRPWALAAPVAVLLICIPALRPLRHPSVLTADEAVRLATVAALLDHGSLELGDAPVASHAGGRTPPTARMGSGQAARLGSERAAIPTELLRHMIVVRGKLYSEQGPVMALVLAGLAWVLERLNLSIRNDVATSAYVLTLLAVTLPVAVAAGAVYRMGRMLDLARRRRALLAGVTVIASGLISYAVMLNSRAPAAALLLMSAAMLAQVDSGPNPARTMRRGLWLVIGGLAAGSAAVLDPAAAVAAVLFIFAAIATTFGGKFRMAGSILFLIGATGPVLVHAAWNVPITGDLLPGNFHRELAAIHTPAAPGEMASFGDESDENGELIRPTAAWQATAVTLDWLMQALLGRHGLLSHFPIVLLGVAGAVMILMRHWPAHVKMLAGAALATGIITVAGYCWVRVDWQGTMFTNQRFVCFVPLLTFWSGAWLLRPHRRWAWVAVGLLLAYSSAWALTSLAWSPGRSGSTVVDVQSLGLMSTQGHRAGVVGGGVGTAGGLASRASGHP